ncbi:hypothetical protein ACLQ2Q_15890 [Microbacterium sp. DT81.1]|uniref:hypothetical protein n=1 Tax=Microbacterium sp. DT81.1 TaxID=3393413 RepID=UPI003CF7EF71
MAGFIEMEANWKVTIEPGPSGEPAAKLENLHFGEVPDVGGLYIEVVGKGFIFDGPAYSHSFAQYGYFHGHLTERGRKRGATFRVRWQDERSGSWGDAMYQTVYAEPPILG